MMAAASASRSAPASSLTPRATSSPTTTSLKKPTKSTSSSPPIRTTAPGTRPSRTRNRHRQGYRSRRHQDRHQLASAHRQDGQLGSAQVGDWVEAIGSPFSLSQTVTAGIVSAKNRTIEPGAAGQFQHFIQTDAAINPGNSGGPLLNMMGEVIGVNTAIYTQSAGYQGIGFAMPSNTVVAIYNDLISPSTRSRAGRSVSPSAEPPERC